MSNELNERAMEALIKQMDEQIAELESESAMFCEDFVSRDKMVDVLVGIIKESGIKLKAFWDWLRGSVGGILAVVFLFFLFTGRISLDGVSDLLFKVVGL